MKLQYMFLANSAEVRDNLLYVMGGTWDNLTVARLPAPLIATLVARISGDDLAGTHTFGIEVAHADGGPKQIVEGEFESKPRVGAWAPAATMAVPLIGMPILTPGFHDVRLRVDGKSLGTTRFQVQLQKPPG